MRVFWTTDGCCGYAERMVEMAVRLGQGGAEERVCAPRDREFAALQSGVRQPLAPQRAVPRAAGAIPTGGRR